MYLDAWVTHETAVHARPEPSSESRKRTDETISEFVEVTRKQTSARIVLMNQRGAIMLAIILNAIYRQFVRAALPGISRQGGKL